MADLFRADPWPAFNLLRGEEASHFGGEGGEGHKKGFDHSLSLFVAQKTKTVYRYCSISLFKLK